jgi:hypothetical protein
MPSTSRTTISTQRMIVVLSPPLIIRPEYYEFQYNWRIPNFKVPETS